MLLTLVLAPVVVLGVRGSAGGGAVDTELPVALAGTWFPDAPEYAGRSLGFAPGWVDIGRGGDDVASYRVREIESFRGVRGEGYRIFHADAAGVVYTLEVHMYDDGSLRLRHPAEVVWRRR